jgi:signal transduction histidine kinase
MGSLRAFVELNSQIILFAYGLVFFVLGLAIAFQSRHYSRLDLARSLSWLAAFGLLHGLYVWGELFSPVQEAYLSPANIRILHILHLIFFSTSGACLFEFGIAVLRPFGRARWLRGFPAGLWIAWAIVGFVILPRVITDPIEWHESTEALARYMLTFPAALLAGYGLRQQTIQRIAPLNVPRIYDMLRVAGIALILYGFFGGLLPPPVPFFPGNVINTDTFEAVVGVPPSVVQSLIGLVLAVAFIRALEIFDVETARRIEDMEQQQILSAERDRIARDLHDGVIQKVYTAGLLVKSAEHQAAADSPIANRLNTAATVLEDAITDLRRNIGELHTTASSESLPAALQRLVEEPRFRPLVDISLNLDLADADTFSVTYVEHIVAIITEALSNVVRHAHARRVNVIGQRVDSHLHLTIQDDGIGLPPNHGWGYGLRNMRDRARLLNGQLEVSGVNGKGTTVSLDIPWKDEHS